MLTCIPFSVLLAVYEKESPIYLSQSLDSVFSQTLLPKEVVLVKDGSLTDELEQIILVYQQKYSLLKVVSLPTNQGLGKALNEGLKYCSCTLIARMDTDDIAKPERFEKQIRIFEEYPEIDVVGAWVVEFEDDISQIKSIRKLPESHEEIRQFAERRNPVNHSVVMFRKGAVLAAGEYQHFPLFEDYYLWVRMLMTGAKFYNMQESLLYFRVSPDMFKRRGGWKYAWNEVRFQHCMLKMGFISWKRFCLNVLLRFPVRIAPNSVRTFIYKKSLR